MTDEIKKKIKTAISHSGFPLEHYIGKALRDNDWRIITNRYYIDDVKNIEREIDILAYKTDTNKEEKIQYYTVLIISCKKSEKYTWCFLTRAADTLDRNIDWSPLHFCTSDARLKYMTENHRDILIRSYKKHSAIKHLYDFPESVFAYQQLAIVENDKKNRKKGDYYIDGNEDMYNSIITTIKALDTEKRSQSKKMHNKEYDKYYMFHLISVFDGIMIKDSFDDEGEHHIEEIDEIKYLNRHIVNNADDFYIVNFVKKENFKYRLNLWDYFHSYNSNMIKYVITEYYKNIFQEKGKVNILWQRFKDSVLWQIKYSLHKIAKSNHYKDVDISYCYGNGVLELNITASPYIEEEVVEKLNSDSELKENVSKQLSEIFRYNGEFCFSDEGLPF